MSLAARLVNVFAVPGEVFDDVKTASHSAANWLLPVLLSCLVGVVGILIVFSQPAVRQALIEKKLRPMEQKLDRQVETGKVSREQADQQVKVMETMFGPTMLKISSSFGMVIYSFMHLFWWALLLWLAGKLLLKARFGFLKAVEVVGLASMIAVLGLIVKALLQVNFSNPAASPSLALMVGEFDERNVSHLLLAMVNLFDLWELAVMAVGLARIACVPFIRAAFPIFSLWIICSLLLGSLAAVAARLGG